MWAERGGFRRTRSSGSTGFCASLSGVLLFRISVTKLAPCMSPGIFDAGDVEKRLGKVEVGNEFVGDGSRFGTTPGPAHHQRLAVRFFIHESLVEPAMIAEIKSLVGRVNHDGVFSPVRFRRDTSSTIRPTLSSTEAMQRR